MKTVKKGNKPANEWQVECSKCGCVFVFDNRDIKSDQREGDWVYCPTCNDTIDVTHRRFWKNDSAINESLSKAKELNLKNFSEDFQKMMEQYGIRIHEGEIEMIMYPFRLESSPGGWPRMNDVPIVVRDITVQFKQVVVRSDNDFMSIIEEISKRNSIFDKWEKRKTFQEVSFSSVKQKT